MTPELLHTFTLALLITAIAALEIRNLRVTAWFYLVNSFFLCAIISAYANLYNPHFYNWAITCFIAKMLIIPYLLFRFIKRVPTHEYQPVIDFTLSIFIISALTLSLYSILKTYALQIAPTPLVPETLSSTQIQPFFNETHRLFAASLSVFGLGIYGLLTRRDAIKTVISLALLENGIHLFLLCLVPTLRETVLIGIVINVIGVVWIILYFAAAIFKVFGTTDTVKLSELKR